MIVVLVSCEEDREPIQCGDIEAFDHERGQQSSAFTLSARTAHEDQGSRLFIMFMSRISLLSFVILLLVLVFLIWFDMQLGRKLSLRISGKFVLLEKSNTRLQRRWLCKILLLHIIS